MRRVARTENCDLLPIFAHSSSISASRSSGGARQSIRPIRSASAASNTSPVYRRRLAATAPTILTKATVPGKRYTIPIRDGGIEKKAVVSAMRKSDPRAIATPPPKQAPLMALIEGLAISRRATRASATRWRLILLHSGSPT